MAFLCSHKKRGSDFGVSTQFQSQESMHICMCNNSFYLIFKAICVEDLENMRV